MLVGNLFELSSTEIFVKFSKTKKDGQGNYLHANYAELDDDKIRRAVIFRKEGDLRVLKLKSALEKIGFRVHLIELQHIHLTLEKSTISVDIFYKLPLKYVFF